ncbi:Phox homologous domain [Phytophthora cactorum]|nr:Phox homologous domain [Phytophthora cactorum]
MSGQLRVAVIGSQTRHPDTPLAYTVYRTSVNYEGLCYHRLIRFRYFSHFGKRLKLAPHAPRVSVKLPPKIWWSRKASLQPETVEARQVLLNEYMQQPGTTHEAVAGGDYAPKEEEDRVINSRLSSRRPSTSFMEPTSEIVAKSSLHNAIVEEEDVSVPASVEKEKQPQDSLTDEEEPSPEEHNGLDITTRDRALSAPLSPVLQVTTRPVSMSLNSQNMKRVMFGSRGDADLLALKEGGRDSTGSASDFSSTPERHYFGQITKCIAGIEDIMDSSRQLEDRIREKQSANRPMGTKQLF